MTDFGLHGLRPPKANAPKWYPGLRADRRDGEALLRGLSTVAYHLTSDA